MDIEKYDKLISFLKANVKTIHSGKLYSLLKHDKRVKQYLGIKKLRQRWIDDYVVKGYFHGNGKAVTESEVKKLLDLFFSSNS